MGPLASRQRALMSGSRAQSMHRFDSMAVHEQVVVCFSHLRWNSVFQRPHHLLTRSANLQRVFYFEEPLWGADKPRLDLRQELEQLWVATPHLPHGMAEDEAVSAQRLLLEQLIDRERIDSFVAWYYTPMALPFSRHLAPKAVIYDCMDELSNFRGAPAELRSREAELFARADVVFTGGQSLFEAKRERHANIHSFPSSIDAAHFRAARVGLPDPADQAALPNPRLGYFGVIDERLDTTLLGGVADARPDWQLVMVGPVVKVDPAELPRRENIHYLGMKAYAELPSYLANWQVALLPFARNDATRFISPTKTLEYLAAAKRVVSTPIHDVIRPYGELGLVEIAATVEEVVTAVELVLAEGSNNVWVEGVDAFLARTSWDDTWAGMMAHVARVLAPTLEIGAVAD